MARRLAGNVGVLNPCSAALTTDESTGANRENRVGRVLNLCFLRYLLLDLFVGPKSHGQPALVFPKIVS